MNYEPIMVSCDLLGGVSTQDGYLPLDSILASLWVRENRPDYFYGNSSAATDSLIQEELPIKRIENTFNKNLWYYACSFCETTWNFTEMTYWHKRNSQPDQIKYVGKGKLVLSKGKTKAFRVGIQLLHTADRLKWYLVADGSWIEDRLRHIPSIGKKRNTGHGIVCNWKVETIAQDWSLIKDGQVMRAMPPQDVPLDKPIKYRVGTYGIRPPYWHNSVMCQCVLPVGQVIRVASSELMLNIAQSIGGN